MPLPEPRPGLVIRYDYLWSDTTNAGGNQGKDRPACLLVAGLKTADPRHVVLLPITQTPPSGDTIGIEIPLKVKRAIGMDDDPSWVIVSESNIDVWPTAGISMVPGRPGEFAYGFLPPGLFAVIKSKFLELARRKKARLFGGNFGRLKSLRPKGQSPSGRLARSILSQAAAPNHRNDSPIRRRRRSFPRACSARS